MGKKEQVNYEDILPKPAVITGEQLDKARSTGRYEGIAFEEYKFAAQLIALMARISKDSEEFKDIPPQHFNVLMGLMNRCSRLMLSTLALSYEGRFGETSAIIFRCITESALKIIWLCTDPNQEKFERYIGDSLKPELELKEMIELNIKERGDILLVEKRMLESIDFHFSKGEMMESQIRDTKKMPDVASLLDSTGFNRLMYVSLYRMGSHHIHGTWPSLLFHYLDKVESSDFFEPRGNDVSTRANEYIAVTLIISRAGAAYSDYCFKKTTGNIFKGLCLATEEQSLNIFKDMEEHGW